MAGKGKAKQRKNKAKSKSKNFNANTQPESLNSNHEKDQIGRINQSEIKESKNKTPDLNKEDSLEKELHTKVENFCNEALQRLLSSGYEEEVAQKAILIGFTNKGFTTYSDVSATGKHVSMNEIVNYFQKNIINLAQKARPDWTKSDAIRYLLANDLYLMPDSFSFPLLEKSEKQRMNIGNSFLGACRGNGKIYSNINTNTSSKDQDWSRSKNVPNCDVKLHINVISSKKGILRSDLRERLKKKVADASRTKTKDSLTNSPAQLYSFASNETRTVVNMEEAHPDNKLILSALNQVRELRAQLKDPKEWGGKKAAQATQNLGQAVLKLGSRMEKMDIKNTMTERQEVEKKKDTKQMLDLGNALLSKSREKALEVAKREKKEEKKVANFEKQRKQQLQNLERAKEEEEVKLREEYDEVAKAIALELGELAKNPEKIDIYRKQLSLRKKMEQKLKAQSSAWMSTQPSPMFEGTSKTYTSKATQEPFNGECRICSKRHAGRVFCAACLERKV